MNKIYKTIWSKTRGMYIVVSEIAHSYRGSTFGLARKIFLTACVLAAVGGLTLQIAAETQELVEYVSVNSEETGNKDNDGATGKDAMAIGPNAVARGDGSIALGLGAETGKDTLSAQHATNSIAIGTAATARGFESVAIGKEAFSEGYAVVIGSEAKTDTTDPQDSVIIGHKAVAKSGNTVVIGGRARSQGNNGIAIGTQSAVENHAGVAIGGVGSLLQPIAVPAGTPSMGAVTLKQNGVALGSQARSSGDSAIAIGLVSHAAEDNAIAIGELSYSASHANAIGASSRALGTSSLVVGTFALATGPAGIALGANSVSLVTPYVKNGEIKSYDGGVSIGRSSFSAGNGAALGRNAAANGYGSTALGAYSKVADPDITDAFVQDKLDTDPDFKNKITSKYASELEKLDGKADWEKNTLVGFAREYLYQEKAQMEGTAVGFYTKVSAHRGVALGARSVADRPRYAIETIAPFSGVDLKWKTYGAVSVGGGGMLRQIINVGDGTEDTDAVNLRQLKAVAKQAGNGAVHYYSAKSIKKGTGTNYANDGAKAQDSIVLGISSTSEGINSTVIGNNNTLTGDKNGRNNSIVVGQNLTVEGTDNAVFGTDYNNYDTKTTHVAGEQNTVLGVGNLVGYTAEKDPNNPEKWVYTKVGTKGSDQNVAVGLTNTANGGSVAVGTSSTVEDLGSSFGHANTVIGSGSGGGQWGVALGNKLTAKGEMALAIGNETTAEGDWTVAIGSESSTAKNFDVAMGYQAKASGGQSIAMGTVSAASASNAIAMGTYTKATVNNGVALGSHSVADTDAGVQGYDPSTNAASVQDDSIWKATLGAVSVGGGASKNTRQITNVAAGFADTDAVNVAQLKALNAMVDGKGTMSSWKLKAKGDTAAETIEDGNEVVFDVKDGEKALTVARDGNTIKYGIDVSKLDFNNTTAITNIANSINNGNTAITNISAKFKVSNGTNTQEVELKKNTSPVLNFTGADKEIDVQVAAGGDGPKVTIGLAQGIKDKLDALDASGNRSVKYDLQADGKTVDTTKITLAGAGGTTITNVKDGAVSKNSKDAVNGSQLNATNERVTKVEGDITNINKQITDLQTQTNENKVTVEGDDKTGVKVESEDIAGGGKNYKVKLDDTIQVGGKNGVVINGKDKVIQGLSNTTLDTGYGEGARAGQAATEGQLKQAFDQAVAGATTTVKEGANITVTKTDGKSEYTVALNKDLTGIDSISVGADAEGKGAVVINKDGINAGDKKITDVANGEISKTSKDAVNGSQLFATNEQVAQNTTNITKLGDQVINLGHDLNDLRDESRDGLAMGAALAALKPLQYDPYDRNQIMAGVGHYKGKSAVALGISHFSNERTMWHAGVALGAKSDTMVNAGVTWRFGGDDERNKLPERYQDGPISSVYVLQDEVTALQTEVAELKEQIRALLAAKA